jgi:subtilisin family serine protease
MVHLVALVAGAGLLVGAAPGVGTADSDGPVVRVAVIDSGIVTKQFPGVAAWHCRRVCRPQTSAPATAHGSQVTAIIGTLAPRARITSYRVVDRNGLVSPAAVRTALRHVQRARFDVVNISVTTRIADPAVTRIIERMPRTVVVSAAGNDGRRITAADPVYPCMVDSPNVVCVGATGDDGRLAPFSGWSRRHVDVAAPGVGVWIPSGGYATGTSFAAPQATALAASVLRPGRDLLASLRSRVEPSRALRGKVAWGGAVTAAHTSRRSTFSTRSE